MQINMRPGSLEGGGGASTQVLRMLLDYEETRWASQSRDTPKPAVQMLVDVHKPAARFSSFP